MAGQVLTESARILAREEIGLVAFTVKVTADGVVNRPQDSRKTEYWRKDKDAAALTGGARPASR